MPGQVEGPERRGRNGPSAGARRAPQKSDDGMGGAVAPRGTASTGRAPVAPYGSGRCDRSLRRRCYALRRARGRLRRAAGGRVRARRPAPKATSWASAAPPGASSATARCSSRSRRGSTGAIPRRSSSGSSGAPVCSSTPSAPASAATRGRGGRRPRTLGPGPHEVGWRPAPDTPVGSYVMRLTVDEERPAASLRRSAARLARPRRRTGRARARRRGGVHAGARTSPRSRMSLRVQADTASFTLTFLRVGHGPDPNLRSDEMTGLPMGDPVAIDWTGKRSTPADDHRAVGTTGQRALRRAARDRRRPDRVRAVRPPADWLRAVDRVAVVLPTNTWQAYNLYDADGDGWGDTWYAGGLPPVVLDRPYRERGVPPRFRRYDFPFLRWLEKTRREPDILADDDLEAIPSGDELRRHYDLVVFPGHSEYMTAHAYDVVERFRDLGGRLVFLSANNFFWGVEKQGNVMRRIDAVASGVPARVAALRRPVPRQRRRPPAGAVRRQRHRRGAVALRGHRPRARQDPRRRGRRVRDRDRHDDAGLAPRDARPRADPEPVRARPQRGDELLRDRRPERGSSRRACWTSPPSCSTPPGSS